MGLSYVSAFTKLLHSTAPMDFVRDIWMLIFLCEFLVLLKGIAKFIKDFTGEEPPFYFWFSRLFLFCWFVARAFWEQIQVRWSDLSIPQENWCHSRQENQQNDQVLLFFSGWDTWLQDNTHFRVAVAQAEKSQSSRLPPGHLFHWNYSSWKKQVPL